MRYKLDRPIVAVADGGSSTRIIDLPAGAILTIREPVSDTLHHSVLLDAEYEGAVVKVFLGDVLQRASLVSTGGAE